VLSAKQSRVVAVLVGIALAGAGMSALNYWRRHAVDQMGRAQVEIAAQRLIEVAEYRLDAALASLDKLDQDGNAGCSSNQLDSLRQAAFSNPWVKEIEVLDGGGRVRCSSSGSVVGPRRFLSANDAADMPTEAISLIQFGDKDRLLRLVVRGKDGTALAAFIPAALFGAHMQQQGPLRILDARMTTRDGTVISEYRAEPPGAGGDSFRATWQSQRFGLVATATMSREAISAGVGHGETTGIFFGAIAMIAVVGFGRLRPRRQSDPILELERAIAANEFVPFYQPVVDIRTGRLRGAEVLIRWHKPDGTIIVPSVFIPLAESTGLIIPLTRALMRRARDEMSAVLAARPNIKIGFNLAALHFADETIVSDVRDIFDKSPIQLRQVILEVTERQPLENLAAARRVIASLQDLGCSVAIDDVGTGHGGLSYMLKLGADTIKIDKMFIDGILTEHHSGKIIESLVDLARNMRMDVVAEGVESFEQVVKLRELGILAAQGHVFCPPVPASSFLQLVEAIAPILEGRVGTADLGSGAKAAEAIFDGERTEDEVLGVAAA
jgi:sensor c-di-GMP phosphodiesterase-like protein